MPAKPSPTPLAPAPSPTPDPAEGTSPSGRISPADRETALAYASLALDRIGEMIMDSDPKVAFPACREILDRAWGKAETSSRGAPEKVKVVVVRKDA